MSYAFDPNEPLGEQCRLVLHERLGLAMDAVAVAARIGEDAEFTAAIHAARKRCKESRALARLIRHAVAEDEFVAFDSTVRQAARELASLRDAHAVLHTFDQLEHSGGAVGRTGGDEQFVEVRRRLVLRRHGAGLLDLSGVGISAPSPAPLAVAGDGPLLVVAARRRIAGALEDGGDTSFVHLGR